MPRRLHRGCAGAGSALHKPLLIAALAITCACSLDAGHDANASTDLIVRWEAPSPPMPVRLDELERILGVPVQYVRAMSGDAHVVRILEPVDSAALDSALRRLTSLPTVRYAVRGGRRVTH